MHFSHRAYSTDLIFYHSGLENCKPCHGYGPAIRDHFLIHFITSGKGIYKVDGKTYELGRGEAFLIWPNVITYYEADEKEPWSYMWIGFSGSNAREYLQKANLNRKNLTFTYKDESIETYIKELNHLNHLSTGKDFYLLGYLYLVLGKICENSDPPNINKERTNNYVKEAVHYIQTGYSRSITINDIAEYLSLDRSYLFTLFKKEMKVSPKQYLIELRMSKACDLMAETSFTISQISRSVGYEDPLVFSRIFKKYKGCSPKNYRKQISLSNG